MPTEHLNNNSRNTVWNLWDDDMVNAESTLHQLEADPTSQIMCLLVAYVVDSVIQHQCTTNADCGSGSMCNANIGYCQVPTSPINMIESQNDALQQICSLTKL